ncbi:Malectin-like carbohydrate-binding domain [Macleaya cordata]|uniref:Malectin-like carbohydrate-binding domain n=1 Tax=Macleaya cordata TaxID=56857 RepID=A0A200QWH0_MACCD|nr:Malectin-like carbohydrate-binding domain [Macleaya cordata]
METFQNLKNRSSYLIFFFFLQISISFNLSWAFIPVDNYLIHCGSGENTLVDNRIFVSDSSGSGSNFLSAARTISLKDQNPIQGSSPLYHTARVFTKPSNYEFEIKEKGTHLVRLHFLPFESSKFNLSNALFHVSVHGFLLLSNFTGQEENHNYRNPLLKEYLIWVDSNKLVLSFLPSKDSSFAFVNAIEVISAPRDLIADTARYVTSEGVENFDGLTKEALETVYRINVGGPKVTPFNDSIWRTWIPDDGFLKLSAASKAISYSGRIKYQDGGASREVAPDNVYNSARIMSYPSVSMPDFNITWIFPVRLGYSYLVRMHFCDIASMALNELYFDVYINGYSAYKDLDISELSGQMLAAPYYADFIVDADSSGDLTVSIGPSSLSSPGRINAILNGLEIMKMNNSMGSFDGEISVGSVLRSQPRAHIGILVPSIALLSLLLAAFVLHRRRSEIKDSMGWSPLPVDVPEGK